MKIVDRKTFLDLPEGTIFASGKRWVFGGLCVKGESLIFDTGNDYTFNDPHWVDADDSGEAIDRLEEMLQNGVSYPMEDAYGRDGCFESEEIYMIFETDDLVKLRSYIDTAIAVQPDQERE